jgi:hypothetical protein
MKSSVLVCRSLLLFLWVWVLFEKGADKVAVPNECGRESRLSELGGKLCRRDRERDLIKSLTGGEEWRERSQE